MLVDQELTLRPLKESDAELFFKWRNDLAYIKHTKSFRLPKHEGLEHEWLQKAMLDKSNSTVVFIIDANEKAIGFVQLSNIDWISRNCFFGIAICESISKQKGFGKRTSKLVLDYAFKELNIHKVSLEVSDFNTNALSLYESLGFSKEGTMKEHYYWSNEYHDVHLYGLLKKDYL